jgi:hypothetical protein
MSRKTKAIIVAAALMLVVAAVYLPKFLGIRAEVVAETCVNRLTEIAFAKRHWALEQLKSTKDVPAWDDLYPYLSYSFTNRWFTNGRPVCPGGGVYALGQVGTLPTCSIGGAGHLCPK